MLAWSKTFEVAGVVVSIISEGLDCSRALQAIIDPYHSITHSLFDVSFHIQKHESTYVLVLDKKKVLWAGSDERDLAPALEVHIYRQVLDKTFPKYMSLHASCVGVGDSAYMFAAVSGSGKSSICTAALLGGASYLTDEFSLLDKNGYVFPFPRPLQWDGRTHPAFSESHMMSSGSFQRASFSFLEAGTSNVLTSHLWLPKKVQHQELPLKAIIIPEYNPSSITELRPIGRGEMLMALREHMHQHFERGADFRELNLRIPDYCPFYKLPYSDVFEAWDLVKDLRT